MLPGQGLVLLADSISAFGTHISDVNFDCLHEIFSLECFTMLDLCSIRETHDGFQEVVDNVFTKRLKNLEVKLSETGVIEITARILSNFGPLIAQLTIRSPYNRDFTQLFDQLFDLVIEHCSDTLKSIKLSCLTISEAQTIKLKPILDKLQKITIEDCSIDFGKMLFSKCESLVELNLTNVKFSDKNLLLENTFPELNRFKYWSYFEGTNLYSDDFFSRHQNLKSLNLCPCHKTSHLLPGIADNCKQLAELVITFDKDEDGVKFEKNLTSILTLDHLNKLGLRGCGQNITNFIKKLQDSKSLEILSLGSVQSDSEFVPALSELTRLKELQLRYCNRITNLNPLADLEGLSELKIFSLSDENPDFELVGIVRRLINLKTLIIAVDSFKMDKKMYLRCVDALRERPGKFHDALRIWCYIHLNANSFGDGYCRKLLRLIRIRSMKYSGGILDIDGEDLSEAQNASVRQTLSLSD